MRAAFIGISPLTLMTASQLIKQGDEVVIIEKRKEKIDEISDDYDCSFILGDGSKPSILHDVSPENTDYLFCFTDNDQDNIIAALVGKEMNFSKVVVKLEDPDFQEVCKHLGLDKTISPEKEMSDLLVEQIKGEVKNESKK